MLSIKALNGKIELEEHKKLTFFRGNLVNKAFLYMACQSERELCTLKLDRDGAKNLIKALEASLLWP